ncbi:MAG TPA: DinB family protein [Bryobacteraceae bacterium]|nr:DinB family protein [Bryobacteraceae bacterium]
MFKQMITGQRGYFQMVHGVTLKLIESFGDEDLDFRPKPGMRSVRDLILHIYGVERCLAEGVRDGRVSDEKENATLPEKPEAAAGLAALTTTAAARQFAIECHKAADDAFAAVTEEQLASQVESPFGTFPGWQFFTFAYDEHWHHRGQLYTYIRLIGKEPPMLYSY